MNDPVSDRFISIGTQMIGLNREPKKYRFQTD